MDAVSFREGALEGVARRSTVLFGVLLIGAALLAAGSGVGPDAIAPALADRVPTLPVLLGLAAREGSDRGTAVERLAGELEGFVSRLRGGEGAAEARPPNLDFALDRDDDLGRLAAAIDDLTSAVRDRERRFDARERELRETNERLEAVVEASPAALIAVDRDGTVELWNPAAERIFGWDAAEVRGEPLPIVPADRTREIDAFRRDLETSEAITGVETKRLRKDGTEIDVSLSKAPLRDADGEVVGAMAAIEDITERKERERRLAATSARLEALFENSPDMIDVLDADGRIVEANERLCEELGYAESRLIGTGIWEHDRRFDEDRTLALLDDLAVGERRKFETQYERRDGSTVDIEVHLIRLDLEDEHRFLAISRDVTDRKADERRLRERERELQRYKEYTDDVLDAIDDVFYVIDEDGAVLRWNEPLEAVSGYDGAEIESMTAFEFFAESDRPAVADAVESALESGSARIEVPIRPADGESIPYEFVASRLEDLEGNAVVAGIGRDISERKERERDLKRYETIVQAVGDPVYTLDASGEIRFINDAIESLAGYDPAELIGSDVTAVLPPDDLERAREQVRELLREGEPYGTVETDFVTADGDVIETETHVALLPMDDGEFAGTAGVVRDITERKERERELERYETIIQAIGDPVYTLDASGTFRFVNDAIESLTGYGPETLIGRDVEDVMTSSNLERARELVRELLREGKPYETFEMDLETADGDVIETENHMALLPMDDGEFAGTAGVVRDITERKERERELERTTELLEQAQRIAGVGGWELDVTTEPYELTVTPQLGRLFGAGSLSEVEPDVTDAVSMYHPEDRPRVLSAVDDAVERGESYDLEVRMYTLDGEERWVRTIGEPVVAGEDDAAPAGDVVAVRGSIQDITDRKVRERDLERTTDFLERVQRMAKVGGWELTVDADPRTAIWTDEMYRLHDLPPDVTPDLERTVECYHPDDRAFVRDRIRTAIETETGYDFEARLLTGEGDVRWVRAISEPIYDGGELRKYRGAVQDISDRKRRELALESLHETARGLLNAETASTVAELVAETAGELHGQGSAAVYLLDSETNRFEPAASTAGFTARSDGAPSVAVGDGDSVLWNAYVTGSQTVVDDAAIGDRSPPFGGSAPGGLLVPIGDYGVFVLLAPPETIDDETRQLFETLVATTEAAFDRLESEANLRERDAELEARNRRLRRQMQITEIIRGIDRSLIGAESRAEIERTVPERLVEADNVAFAWIGDPDASDSALEPRSWAGEEPGYLDALDLDLDGGSREPSVRAARSETPTVVENVVEGLQDEPWRRDALDAGFQSVVAVPLRFEEYSYGVLTVYADEPDAFTDLERTVFAELGEGIANAITEAKTREALHAETLVELTLDLEGDDVLSRIATATDATVTYEGLGTDSSAETVLFFETSGASAADVRAVLDDLVAVREFRLISDSDGDCLFEATVTGEVVASRLVRHGASPRSITAAGDRLEVVVDVPPATDVREFVEMLADPYDDVDLRSRRHVQRAMHTRRELVASLFDELTDRQLEVLRTAYLAGFFEWPRESTGEEIADLLDVTQPTVNRHLRVGQQRLLSELFESERLAPIDAS